MEIGFYIPERVITAYQIFGMVSFYFFSFLFFYKVVVKPVRGWLVERRRLAKDAERRRKAAIRSEGIVRREQERMELALQGKLAAADLDALRGGFRIYG
jgi:hypothetical protein